MELPCAWTITKGDPSINIGILDIFTGSHTDLPNLSISQDYTCTSNTACSHGFAVAGGAGAEHNSLCIAGAAPDATINGYCVATGSGCSFVNPAIALWDAYQDGNNIINVSASGIGGGSVVIMQIQEMVANGVVLTVAAIGAAHFTYANIPGVINVAQMDINGNFIQYGSVQELNVDIGVNIINLYRLQTNNTCDLGFGGSSMAAPYVAGTVALMMDVNPCLTPAEIEIILEQTSTPAINGDDPGENWYQKTEGGQMNAYEAVLAASQISTGKTIYFDETWDIPQSFSGRVVVKDGATLTINTTTRFTHKYAGITVEQGGRLVVDGARLTVGCDNSRWEGIEVYGSPSVSQLYPDQQGIVDLKNGATIENAEIGVSLHRRHPVTLGGGILLAVDANFINNQRAISLWDYENLFSGSSYPNSSKIENCNFVINEDFPITGFNYPAFSQHIGLFQVNGINIKDSNFKDERSTDITTPNGGPTGHGIETINGGFTVENCTFEGLVYGILANTVNSTYTFRVRNSSFTDNYQGIHTRGIDNFEVRENNFAIGGFDRTVNGISDITTQAGLFVDHGSGFTIRENVFTSSGGSADEIGICTKNTNLSLYGDEIIGSYNQIYANKYDGLVAANVANGVNQAFLTGLTYICNENGENVANEMDFTIADGVIATNQFSPNNLEAAGNSFTVDPTCVIPFRHIDNSDDANFISYHYYAGANDEKPNCFPFGKVFNIADNENECSLTGLVGDYPDDRRDSLRTFAENERAYFDGIYSLYKDSINGGNTSYLIAYFDSLSSSSVSPLFNELIDISPYLSGEIIRRVVDEPLFSAIQKIDILKSAPEEIKRYHNWNHIEDSGIFKSSELATLKDKAKIATARDSIERLLKRSLGRLHQSIDGLMISYLHDTTGVDLDSIRYGANIKNNLRAKLLVVDSYLQQRDTLSAFYMLDSISQNYSLTTGQQNEYDQLITLYSLHKDLIRQDKGWHELDAYQLGSIKDIADYDQTLAGVKAQNVLNSYFGEGFYHEPILPSTNKSLRELPSQNIPQAINPAFLDLISVFPNPAKNHVTFEYNLPNGVNEAELVVRNLKGQVMKKFLLDAETSRVTWELGNLPNGLYSYTLLLSNGMAKTYKLVVLKN